MCTLMKEKTLWYRNRWNGLSSIASICALNEGMNCWKETLQLEEKKIEKWNKRMLPYKSYGVLWLLDNCALTIELLMFKEFHGRWMHTCEWTLIFFPSCFTFCSLSLSVLCILNRIGETVCIYMASLLNVQRTNEMVEETTREATVNWHAISLAPVTNALCSHNNQHASQGSQPSAASMFFSFLFWRGRERKRDEA